MKYVKLCFFTVILLLLTGCLLKEEGKGYLTKTCTISETYDSFIKEETVSVTHLGNDITKIFIKKIYENIGSNKSFINFKDSFLSEKNSLKNEAGLNIEVVSNNNTLEVNYTFDYENTSDYVKELYKIDNPYHIQIKNLEEQGYTCK